MRPAKSITGARAAVAEWNPSARRTIRATRWLQSLEVRVGEAEPDRGEDPVAAFAEGTAGLDERLEPAALRP